LQRLLGERSRAKDSCELRLVHNGLEVAENVGELGTKGGIDCRGKGGLKLSGKRNIRKGYALRYEESTGRKMFFHNGEGGKNAVLEDSVYLENKI